MSYVTSVKENTIADFDIIIVTWWTTALEVGKLSEKKGKKINLIQGFENWTGHEELLYSSYNMPDTLNVVVASYLKSIVEKHSHNRTELIPNAIDTEKFHITTPVEQRNNNSVCMMYSIQEIKGSEYGLEALKIVKKKYPELVVDLFGICPQPEGLPVWITYYHDISDLSVVFNKNAVYITNSLTEGMALTPMEAMSCGCALICTDIPGHAEYAHDKETALTVETKNPEKLAEKIIFLIENNDERTALAERGNEYIKKFSWDKAVVKMNNLIQEVIV